MINVFLFIKIFFKKKNKFFSKKDVKKRNGKKITN